MGTEEFDDESLALLYWLKSNAEHMCAIACTVLNRPGVCIRAALCQTRTQSVTRSHRRMYPDPPNGACWLVDRFCCRALHGLPYPDPSNLLFFRGWWSVV